MVNPSIYGGQYTFGGPIPAAGIVKDDPMPAQMVPPGAFQAGTIRPELEDVWMVDADTVRMITAPVDTRGIDTTKCRYARSVYIQDKTVLGSSVSALRSACCYACL